MKFMSWITKMKLMVKKSWIKLFSLDLHNLLFLILSTQWYLFHKIYLYIWFKKILNALHFQKNKRKPFHTINPFKGILSFAKTRKNTFIFYYMLSNRKIFLRNFQFVFHQLLHLYYIKRLLYFKIPIAGNTK